MNTQIQLQVQLLHADAVAPIRATEGSCGLDLTALRMEISKRLRLEGGKQALVYTYYTGIAVAIPEGHVGLLFPRSSISKTGMDLTNCVGVIDSDYRGEIQMKFRMRSNEEQHYVVGDRIGQLVILPAPQVSIQVAETLPPTARGDGGFGSTGV